MTTDPRDPRPALDFPSPGDPYDAGRLEETLSGRGGGPSRRRHPKDYLRIIYRRRRLMASVFLLVLITTVVYSYTRVPMFEARAKLLIESSEPQYVGFDQVVDQARGRDDYRQTQFDLLRSRSLARRTLEVSNLWDEFGAGASTPDVVGDAAAGPPRPVGTFARLQAMVSPVTRIIRGSPVVDSASSSAPEPSETAVQAGAINGFLGGLVVVPYRNSRVVDLAYRSTDPDLATRAVNAHARSYIEQNMEFKFQASKEASDWLAARLADQRKEVEAAESALQQYREQHDAVAADSRENIVIQKLADMSSAVTQAKTQRLERESRYNQLRAAEKDPAALETYPAVLGNPLIQTLQAELAQLQRKRLDMSKDYLDTHPDMVALMRQIGAARTRVQVEIDKVVEAVKNDYQAAVAQERALMRAQAEQKQEALAMGRTAIEYGVLSREVESTRSVYQTLLQRAQETGVSGEQRTSNVRVVDFAERPRSPYYPQTRSSVTRGAMWGLVLALLIGFFFEYFDNRVRTLDEIKAHLKIPGLGMLPMVRDKPDAAKLLAERESPRFLESLRALRTNVIFSTAESTSRSLVVTSTGPSEGKTAVSSHLAAALAETGLRVLVIDGDMRKPRLHAALGIAQEPGLSNLIVGSSKASEVVVKTSVPGLWAIAAGRVPPNPSELLGSPRFRDFLLSLRDHFDWVVIDTPPVMAVTDASVIAHRASGVIFVVGADMVSRDHAIIAIEQLERANGKLLGAVLNRVDADKNAYYYSPYYRKAYTEYYQQRRDSL